MAQREWPSSWSATETTAAKAVEGRAHQPEPLETEAGAAKRAPTACSKLYGAQAQDHKPTGVILRGIAPDLQQQPSFAHGDFNPLHAPGRAWKTSSLILETLPLHPHRALLRLLLKICACPPSGSGGGGGGSRWHALRVMACAGNPPLLKSGERARPWFGGGMGRCQPPTAGCAGGRRPGGRDLDPLRPSQGGHALLQLAMGRRRPERSCNCQPCWAVPLEALRIAEAQ